MGRVGVRGAEYLFADRQCPLGEGPSGNIVALHTEQFGKVVEALGRVGVHGAEYLFADRQCPLGERPGGGVVAHLIEQCAEFVKRLCDTLLISRVLCEC